MINHIVETHLSLTHPVLSIISFDRIKEDAKHQNFLNAASLYIVGKRERPLLSINKDKCGRDMIALKAILKKQGCCIDILIPREGNPDIGLEGFVGVEGFMGLVDDIDEIDIDKYIKDSNKKCNAYDKEYPTAQEGSFKAVFTDTDLSEFEVINVRAKGSDGNEHTTAELTFDDILYYSSHGDDRPHLLVFFDGNIVPFVTFNVLYIGQCTDELLTKRFKAHHALQEMLIREKAITPDLRNSEELFLFPMMGEGDILSIIGGWTNPEEAERAFTNEFTFGSREVTLDAEKALVHGMNPKYNKIKFVNYPESKDGLYNTEADVYCYILAEYMVLHYKDGDVVGNRDVKYASRIVGDKKGFAHIFAPGEDFTERYMRDVYPFFPKGVYEKWEV